MDRSQANRSQSVQRIATASAAALGAWFLLTRSSNLLAAVGSVASLGPAILPAGLGLVALGVLNRGSQARQAYRLVGIPAGLAPMVELSASSYATNKVVKSCGAAGLVPFLTDAHRRGHSRAKVSAAYMSMKVAETFSLCALIAVAVIAGVTTHALHGATLYAMAASLVYALTIAVTLLVLASSRSTANAAERLLRRISVQLRSLLHRAERDPEVSAAHELVDVLARVRSEPGSGLPLFLTALVGKAIGVACLALVLAGFGTGIGLPATVLVYTLTLMASMIGPLPGGVGVAEASLGALLVARGAPAPAAVAAVIAFRLLDLWIPLLVGAAAGLVHSRRRPVEPAAHPSHATPGSPSAIRPSVVPVSA